MKGVVFGIWVVFVGVIPEVAHPHNTEGRAPTVRRDRKLMRMERDDEQLQ